MPQTGRSVEVNEDKLPSFWGKFVGNFGIIALVVASLMSGAVASQIEALDSDNTSGPLAILPTPTPAQATTTFRAYRGVSLGMSAAAAREKLGAPKEKADTGDYYLFSETETAQILYDTDHTVRAISITFLGNLGSAPSSKDVVGTDVKAEADGSINKLARYPKAGYWVSYIRTGGDDPMIVITLQKMPIEQ